MLLFPRPSTVVDGWQRSAQFPVEATGITVIAAVSHGRHAVWLGADSHLSDSDGDSAGETVGPIDVVPGVEPVSPVHLPPYYRWTEDGWSFEFQSSKREGAPLVAASLRHLRSLRRHPRALVVEAEATDGVDDAPIAALVVGTPTTLSGDAEGPRTLVIEWRGWHVVEVDDPFRGVELHVLATHTRAARKPSQLA